MLASGRNFFQGKLLTDTAAWWLFLAAVAAATVFPLLVIAPVRHLFPNAAATFVLFNGVNVVGGMGHVAATSWFYSDRDMRGHFISQPGQFLLAPGLLIAGTAVLCLFLNDTGTQLLSIAFFTWQLWHYQKQNFGILSFVCAGTDRVPLTDWERRTLTLAGISGILGFFKTTGSEFASPQLNWAIGHAYEAGFVLYCLVPLPFAIAVVRNPALRLNRVRLAFFALGSLFFLPTYVFSDGILAVVLGYATGHGLQCLVFMSVVAGRVKRPVLSMLVLLGAATLGGLFLVRMMGLQYVVPFPYANLLHGALLGVVMTHFVVDARIWRLREAFPRAYLKRKFSFVFDRVVPQS